MSTMVDRPGKAGRPPTMRSSMIPLIVIGKREGLGMEWVGGASFIDARMYIVG